MMQGATSARTRFARAMLTIAAVLLAACGLTGQAQPPAPSANDRMLEPGPEAKELARRVGTWDVVNTFRPAPAAAPIVRTGLVAERVMIGLYLQEVMKPAPGSNVPDFRRMEYLTYNSVEARWQYVSMDTRVPMGLMPARSVERQQGSSITVYFDNAALAGFGPQIEGRLFRARHVTTVESADRDVSRQYWISPGNDEWLAVEYDYTRMSAPAAAGR